MCRQRRTQVLVNRLVHSELEQYLDGLKQLSREWVIDQVRQEMGVARLLDLDHDHLSRAKELIQHYRKITDERIAVGLRYYEKLKRKREISQT
ncbi:hypothetical protein HYR54_15845 [Candidatus Acetothermia bacterium]|nr:hypothetical protein [Candidatus Acetothermia bacterium]